MHQTIKDLWNGNIAPVEHCGAYNPEINRLHALIERNRENLSKGLSDAQMEVFQKYVACSDEYLLQMLELAFCDGFCIGSKLTMETLL